MRLTSVLLFPASLLVVAIAACSSSPAATGNGGDNTDTTPTGVPNRTDSSCLGKEGLAFDNAACSSCMNGNGCCEATIACFKGNAECTALQACMVACGGGAATTTARRGLVATARRE